MSLHPLSCPHTCSPSLERARERDEASIRTAALEHALAVALDRIADETAATQRCADELNAGTPWWWGARCKGEIL